MSDQGNILDVSQLSVHFGGIKALNGVDFTVARGSITALIGPNGAGKTTVFNCLTGFYKATKGQILLNTESQGQCNIVKIIGEKFKSRDFLSPVAFASKLYYKMFGGSHQVTRAGLARTFQNIRLFRDMTVLENLLVAQHTYIDKNLVGGLFGLASYTESEQKALGRAKFWLEFMGLAEFANRQAGNLPYGFQRKLEIARALCCRPEILCLDEPAAGLNPQETDDLAKLIQRIRSELRVTVLVIEHDMSLVMSISDAIVVLNYGEVIARGKPDEIKENPEVLSAYLGE